MTSWLNKRLFGVSLMSTHSRKTIDHKAIFLCKLFTSSIDESSYEKVRHQLEQSSGVETRVRITPEGLKSGSKKTAHQIPIEFYSIENVEALTVDTVHFNVLICVIQYRGGPQQSTTGSALESTDLAFHIIAFKFDNDQLPRRYVDCFESIKGRSTENGSKKKNKSTTKHSKKKVSKTASAGVAIDNDREGSQLGMDARRVQSLMPGRPAAATGALASDRWTARDRSTPRLFASASVDDLLAADGNTRPSASRVTSTTLKKNSKIGPNAMRSRSYEGGLDELGPGDHVVTSDDDEETADGVEVGVVDGGGGNGDMDEDAADAGDEFWKEVDDDDNVTGNVLRAQFRGGAVGGFGASLAASRGAWSSMDNMAERRSIDNWSSDSSGVSSRFELVRCRDVGVTARFPAATDPKKRPWRMDCIRFSNLSDSETANVMCQVDMPRLRPELAGKNSVDDSAKNIAVNKMVLSDEELSDGVNGNEDDDGWDFGSDDVMTTVPPVVDQPIVKFVNVPVVTTSGSNAQPRTSSSAEPTTDKPAQQRTSAFVKPDRPRSGTNSLVISDGRRISDSHRRRRSDALDDRLPSPRAAEFQGPLTPPAAAGIRRQHHQQQVLGSPTGSRTSSGVFEQQQSVSGRRRLSSLRPHSVFVQSSFEHHYAVRKNSSSSSSSTLRGTTPTAGYQPSSPLLSPLPPPPPPPPPALPSSPNSKVAPLSVRIPAGQSSRGSPSLGSPELPSPPPMSQILQSHNSRNSTGAGVYQNLRM